MNIKSFVLKISLFSICICQTNAQITINGTITDNNLNPIPAVLVEIIDEADTNNRYSDYTDASGNFTISNITSVDDNDSATPGDYIILSNYPNPFNPSTVIYFELPGDEDIEIKIFDILGREVRSLYNDYHSGGAGAVIWDGRNNRNIPVSSGVYFCRLKTKDRFKVHKMVFLDGGQSASAIGSVSSPREKLQKNQKANDFFRFTIRVTGSNILETKFSNVTCSGDTTLHLIIPRIIKTVTIGPDGGKLETEEFSLSIPPESFTEVVDLSLGIETYYDDYFETRLTKVFRVDGLPDILYRPLRVMLKNETTRYDSLYIAVGTSAFDIFFENEVTFFNYYDAFDSSGYIISPELPFHSDYTKPIAKINKYPYLDFGSLLLTALTDVNIMESEHFRFESGISELSQLVISDILEVAEQAYSDFCELLNQDKDIFWDLYKIITGDSKMRISPAQSGFRTNKYCYIPFRYDVYKRPCFRIYISDEKLLDETMLPFIKQDLYHHLYFVFPFVRYLDKGMREPNQLWLHHAIAYWSEELFNKAENFTPLEFFMGLWNPFTGTPPTGTGYEFHGYNRQYGMGMSAFIKYLTNIYGNSIVAKIFDRLYDDRIAIEAIMNVLMEEYNHPEYIWWPDFYKEFIQGNIYNVPSKVFVNLARFEEWLSSRNPIEFIWRDTTHEYTSKYADLSAKLIRINIKCDDIKNNKSLRFKIDPKGLNIDYVKVLVFGLKGDDLIFISEGNHFSIGHLYNYDALLACVVNSANEAPYTEYLDITLDITVSDDPFFKYCDIKISVVGIVDTFKVVWNPGWYTLGSFIDNEYTGTIRKEKQGGNTVGPIQVKVQDNFTIDELDVMAYHSDEYGTSQWGFAASNIPPTEKERYMVVYNHRGSGVCNYIRSVYKKYTYPDGRYSELSRFECDTNSYIHIKFHNWD